MGKTMDKILYMLSSAQRCMVTRLCMEETIPVTKILANSETTIVDVKDMIDNLGPVSTAVLIGVRDIISYVRKYLSQDAINMLRKDELHEVYAVMRDLLAGAEAVSPSWRKLLSDALGEYPTMVRIPMMPVMQWQYALEQATSDLVEYS